jgi:hypothetical protein
MLVPTFNRFSPLAKSRVEASRDNWNALALLLVAEKNLAGVKSISDKIAIKQLELLPGANATAVARVANHLAYVDHFQYLPIISTNVQRIVRAYSKVVL